MKEKRAYQQLEKLEYLEILDENQKNGAEGPLLDYSALSAHRKTIKYLKDCLNKYDLIMILNKLGASHQIPCNLETCGKESGQYSCPCGKTHGIYRSSCNYSVCPRCAIRRRNRLRTKYLKTLKKHKNTNLYTRKFLTISPQNEPNLRRGIIKLAENWKRFLKLEYIKNRILGSIYCIEWKKGVGGWNIHLHAIIYSRFLDHHIRGKCADCGQGLLRFDPDSKLYYCATRKCHSTNVKVINKDTKLTRSWTDNYGNATLWVTKQWNAVASMNYLLSYLTDPDKTGLTNEELAEQIIHTRKKVKVYRREMWEIWKDFWFEKHIRRYIRTTGIYYDNENKYRLKMKKIWPDFWFQKWEHDKISCPHCNGEIKFNSVEEIKSWYNPEVLPPPIQPWRP